LRNSWSFMYGRWTAVHIQFDSWSVLRSGGYSTVRVHSFVFIFSQAKFKFGISGRLSGLSRTVIPNAYVRESLCRWITSSSIESGDFGICSSPVCPSSLPSLDTISYSHQVASTTAQVSFTFEPPIHLDTMPATDVFAYTARIELGCCYKSVNVHSDWLFACWRLSCGFQLFTRFYYKQSIFNAISDILAYPSDISRLTSPLLLRVSHQQ